MAPVGGPPSAVEFLLTLTRAILPLQLTLVPANLAPQRPLPTFWAAAVGRHRGSYPFPRRKRESTLLCSRSTPPWRIALEDLHSSSAPREPL
jgi:hypothetical protein